MFHPVTSNGRVDMRYTVTREHTGRDRPHYVARFCGDWIGSSEFYGSAAGLAIGHAARRRGCAVVEGIPA